MLMSPIIIVCGILRDLERYIYKHCKQKYLPLHDRNC